MSDTIDTSTLNSILNSLVTVPEKVDVNRKVDEMGVLLQVKVDPKDMGIVIGRNGVMATAIKTIMKAVGKANNMNVRIQFLEPDGTLKYGSKKDDKTSNSDQGEQPSEPQAKVNLDEDINDLVIN
jgi:uncharacterized protein